MASRQRPGVGIQHVLWTCRTDPVPQFYIRRAGLTWLYIGPESYLRARREPELYPDGAFISADGFLFAALWRALGKPSPTLKTFDFSSMADEVFAYSAKSGLSVGLIGGNDDEAAGAQAYLEKSYPGMQIALCRSGYFPSDQLDGVAREIAARRLDVLVVGVGFPRQNRLIAEVRRLGCESAAFSCGAFISQMARGGRYYPRWVVALHLRWAYRMAREPYVILRVLRSYPLGLALFVYDWLRFRK